MTIMDMLGQSGTLTALGMSIVFGFLAILIICVTLMGKAVHALGWDKDVTESKPGGTPPGGTANNAAVTAAISAAVNEYRKNNP